MNMDRCLLVMLLSVLVVASAGCSKQAWYEGVKEGAKNNCRSQPPSEVEACLERVNTKTYEEYEKQRSSQK